jgi:hypothetical protein
MRVYADTLLVCSSHLFTVPFSSSTVLTLLNFLLTLSPLVTPLKVLVKLICAGSERLVLPVPPIHVGFDTVLK